MNALVYSSLLVANLFFLCIHLGAFYPLPPLSQWDVIKQCPLSVVSIWCLTSPCSQLLSETINNFVSQILEGSEYHPFDPFDKSTYPWEGFSKLVSVVVTPSRSWQVGSSKAGEQQGQKEIQNLKNKIRMVSLKLY